MSMDGGNRQSLSTGSKGRGKAKAGGCENLDSEQQILFFLLHCEKCQTPGNCIFRHFCAHGQKWLEHIEHCTEGEHCKMAACSQAKPVWMHKLGCRFTRCQKCNPVKRAMKNESSLHHHAQAVIMMSPLLGWISVKHTNEDHTVQGEGDFEYNQCINFDEVLAMVPMLSRIPDLVVRHSESQWPGTKMITEVLRGQDRVCKEQIRWLALLQHSEKCEREKCEEFGRLCTEAKKLSDHQRRCNSHSCRYPQCSRVRSIKEHYRSCQFVDCSVCPRARKFLSEIFNPKRGRDAESPMEIDSGKKSKTDLHSSPGMRSATEDAD